MASKRRMRRRKCSRKEAHDRAGAEGKAASLRRSTRLLYEAYACPYGDHWHVGRRPKSVQRAINQRRRDKERHG